MPTKLIEVALPLDVINREAAREKSIRHGHPSTLHLWWARRPLAACRAVLFAQLVDDPSAHPELFPTEADQERERKRLFDIIEQLFPWEASSDEKVLEAARSEIRRCYPAGTPTIVDPFCGGGAIPLEAQRLGLEVHASDLNPVAVLVTKALIELPPKFADRPPVHPDSGKTLPGTQSWRGAQGLADDVRYYGQWMRDEAERRIGRLYPKADLPGGKTATIIAWLWARTITCPNPACRSTMPLVRSFWLGKKKGKEAWVRAIPVPTEKRVRFEIGHGKEGPHIDGTVNRSGAMCLICGAPVPRQYLYAEGRKHHMGQQLMAIAAEGSRQRMYLPPTEMQELAATIARPDDIPDSEMPDNPRWFSPPMYGMAHHSDLFTNRQLTALCAFSDLVGETRKRVLDDGGDKSYADAIATYLAFAVDRCADYGSSVTSWASHPKQEAIRNTFARQAIAMTWDFGEANFFADSAGSLSENFEWIAKVIERLPARCPIGSASQLDAASRSFSNLVVATDPPYYDNIGYADLSDFFYVWLRRSLREIYPELLSTLLTPKSGELIATPYRFGGDKNKAEDHFESGFRKVFAHAAEQASSDTPMTIFYAFKQSEVDDDGSGLDVSTASTGWEKMLQGLLRSGLQVTGTWPMRTELGNRILSMGTNALASSIILVCRPRTSTASITDRRGFIQTLKSKLGDALRDLQSGGVAPVDLAQAAIGPGMAVFSSYGKVVEPDGTAMQVRTALALINRVLDEVSAEQEGEFDEDTRWAIAWYAENGVDVGPYGRADDLSRAKNVSVDGLVRAGIVKSGGGKVRLLERDELAPAWDPTTDNRLTVWEITQHLIRRLLDGGEASAAELLAKVGDLGDAARDLAYRLFLIAESKKWAKEAAPYNALAASWLEISRLAAIEPDGQGSLFEGGADGPQ
jgi:putative DNA methylase